jgi:hypothetical protein
MSGGSKRSKTINLVLMPTALLFGVLPLLDACKKHVPEQDISDKSDSIPSAPVPVADTPEPSSSVGDMFTSVDQCKAARVDPDDPNSDPLYPPEECDRANALCLL